MAPSANGDIVTDNVQAAVEFATQRYGVNEATARGAVISVAHMVGDHRAELGRLVLAGLLAAASIDVREAARDILSNLPTTLSSMAVGPLLSNLNNAVTNLIGE